MHLDFQKRQAELNTALEQHEALALLGRMSATLAHELKTPISTISNLVQTLPARYSDQQFRKRFITLMQEELNRTQHLIDNLLAYGKEIDLRNEAWILLMPFLSDMAVTSAAKIAVDVRDNIEIYGDKFYLELLFNNLIRNSYEAGASKLHVRINSSSAERNSFAELKCEDNGTGFPPASDIETLTNPFVTNRSRGGGLGLYLAKKIVEAHDGSLSLYRAGKGAGIKIFLPRKRVKINGEHLI